MGVSRYLKGKNPDIQIVGLQPADGASIAGIRRWPKAYLPHIFEVLDLQEKPHVLLHPTAHTCVGPCRCSQHARWPAPAASPSVMTWSALHLRKQEQPRGPSDGHRAARGGGDHARARAHARASLQVPVAALPAHNLSPPPACGALHATLVPCRQFLLISAAPVHILDLEQRYKRGIDGMCHGRRRELGRLGVGGAAAVAEVDNATIVCIICDRGDRYLSTGALLPYSWHKTELCHLHALTGTGVYGPIPCTLHCCVHCHEAKAGCMLHLMQYPVHILRGLA